MTFADFPFDKQTLEIQFGYDHRDDGAVELSDGVIIRYKSDELHGAMGWSVTSMGFSRAIVNTSDPNVFIRVDPDDHHPFKQHHAVKLVSTLYIDITRVHAYYVFNIIIPLSLLTAISWCTFFHPAEAIDARMALVMTSFLALVAFQFVVNSSLPQTTEYTRLQNFVFGTTLSMVFIAGESAVVYFLIRRQRWLREHRTTPRDDRKVHVQMKTISTSSPSTKNQDDEDNTHTKKTEMDDATHALDLACIYIFPLLYVTMSCATLIA